MSRLNSTAFGCAMTVTGKRNDSAIAKWWWRMVWIVDGGLRNLHPTLSNRNAGCNLSIGAAARDRFCLQSVSGTDKKKVARSPKDSVIFSEQETESPRLSSEHSSW